MDLSLGLGVCAGEAALKEGGSGGDLCEGIGSGESWESDSPSGNESCNPAVKRRGISSEKKLDTN